MNHENGDDAHNSSHVKGMNTPPFILETGGVRYDKAQIRVKLSDDISTVSFQVWVLYNLSMCRCFFCAVIGWGYDNVISGKNLLK